MLRRIEDWFFDHPVLTDLLTILIPCALVIGLGILSNSCSAIKEIPVNTVERVEYRDSLIYIKDTVTVEVPHQVVKEIIPELDTSYLSTSLAGSVAYLDTTNRKIHHTLEQKGTVQTVVDTLVEIQYVDRYIEREQPIEVVITKYKYDSLFWILLAWTVLTLVYIVIRLRL